MKVLLDECVPRRLRRHLPTHEIKTAPEMGWSGIKNGALLRRAADAGFDVFVTVDRNLSFQQNISSLPLAVLVIAARSNRLTDLLPLVPTILEALPRAKAGNVICVP